MVLATHHLSVLGDDFEPACVSSLLDVLERFAPDVIAVESLPPAEIRRLLRETEASPDGGAAQLLSAFAGDAVRGAELAEATSPGPSSEGSPATARAAARQHLLDLDVPSALLQWSYVPEVERGAGGSSDELAEFLNRRLDRPNEVVSIGVALARRLGHASLLSVDDHVDDEIGLDTGLNVQLMGELSGTPQLAELMASGYLQEGERRLAEAAAGGDLLPLYRQHNSPEFQAEDVSRQWHLFYRTNLPSRLDRARAA
ncbi:MAG: hypothetical protein ACYTJ0_16230, partial [Planctomycetota bacterium]